MKSGYGLEISCNPGCRDGLSKSSTLLTALMPTATGLGVVAKNLEKKKMKKFFFGELKSGIRRELIEMLLKCDIDAQSPFIYERDAANASWLALRKHLSLDESFVYDKASFSLYDRMFPDFMVMEALSDARLN